MKLIDVNEIKKVSNEEVLAIYKKACMGMEHVFGIHPMSHAYSDIISDLEEEVKLRMG